MNGGSLLRLIIDLLEPWVSTKLIFVVLFLIFRERPPTIGKAGPAFNVPELFFRLKEARIGRRIPNQINSFRGGHRSPPQQHVRLLDGQTACYSRQLSRGTDADEGSRVPDVGGMSAEEHTGVPRS